ncbi:hypothetical protein [Hazenella coriacea]|uniref:Uncharacterized protein n=1 Tax=Hazenella coriacea TaxID=1179467 RepID=A0A4R3L136_9BACL|nr:hypothetical protein [Hazenella coriacea]TCS93251.1 hypothetical protein EDD58_10865 [Hazenella coriacea]
MIKSLKALLQEVGLFLDPDRQQHRIITHDLLSFKNHLVIVKEGKLDEHTGEFTTLKESKGRYFHIQYFDKGIYEDAVVMTWMLENQKITGLYISRKSIRKLIPRKQKKADGHDLYYINTDQGDYCIVSLNQMID